jgi:hypothetical protein
VLLSARSCLNSYPGEIVVHALTFSAACVLQSVPTGWGLGKALVRQKATAVVSVILVATQTNLKMPFKNLGLPYILIPAKSGCKSTECPAQTRVL